MELKDVVAYCAENIEDWDLKCQLALNRIGRHEPIDYDFRDEIYSCVEEWCDDNEVSIDFFDDIDEEEIIMYCK